MADLVNFSGSPVAGRRQLALALPGLIVVVGGLVLTLDDGGYPPTVWYPAALFALVLLAVVVIAVPPSRLEPRSLLLALCAFGLFALLAYASITWADDQGAAWLGAKPVLLFGVLALSPATGP